LLPRDEVARAINSEVKAGRGTPHSGVFLDIASRRPADYIQRRLPSMYHQFKELADVDITKEAMEVGPTCHYCMGGVRVDADSTATTVPGLFAAGEVAAGLHGANRLGGNSLSDLVVFGRRAGEYAAKFAKDHPSYSVSEAQIEEAAKEALAPLERPVVAAGPFQIQYELQALMQEKAGIAREEDGLTEAVAEIRVLRARASEAGAGGNRSYNPGWHTALDLEHLLTVSEAIALAARERKESRGAHSRIDHLGKDPAWSTFNHIVRKGPDGEMEVVRRDIPTMRQELKDIIEEQG
jgi:succinate dehydrogenase / fumarate reductase flavoprotein subunit